MKCSGSNPESALSSLKETLMPQFPPGQWTAAVPWQMLTGFLPLCQCSVRFFLVLTAYLIRATTAAPPIPRRACLSCPLGPVSFCPTSSSGWDLLCSSQFFWFSVDQLLVLAPFTLESHVDWETQISTKGAWQLQAENPAGTAGGRFPWKGMRYAFLRASLQPGVSHIDPVCLPTHPSIRQLCPRHWGSTSEPPALLPLTCEHLSRVGTGRAL